VVRRDYRGRRRAGRPLRLRGCDRRGRRDRTRRDGRDPGSGPCADWTSRRTSLRSALAFGTENAAGDARSVARQPSVSPFPVSSSRWDSRYSPPMTRTGSTVRRANRSARSRKTKRRIDGRLSPATREVVIGCGLEDGRRRRVVDDDRAVDPTVVDARGHQFRPRRLEQYRACLPTVLVRRDVKER